MSMLNRPPTICKSSWFWFSITSNFNMSKFGASPIIRNESISRLTLTTSSEFSPSACAFKKSSVFKLLRQLLWNWQNVCSIWIFRKFSLNNSVQRWSTAFTSIIDRLDSVVRQCWITALISTPSLFEIEICSIELQLTKASYVQWFRLTALWSANRMLKFRMTWPKWNKKYFY